MPTSATRVDARIKMTRRIGLVVLAFALGFVLLEGALQIGSWVVVAASDRSGGSVGTGDRFRILCVGDSNTYGLYVRRYESYPAQLQAALAALETERPIEVVNLGVPGSNSAQLLNRLPTYLDRYAPDLLIILIGAADHWNPAEMDDVRGENGARLRDWLWRSRVLRLVSLAVENLRHREPTPAVADSSQVEVTWEENLGPTTLRSGDLEVEYRHVWADSVSKERHAELLEGNLERIVTLARARGVPLVLPTYAPDVWQYTTANRVIRAAKGALVIPASFREDLVPREPELLETGREALFFQPSQHPTPRIYRSYALLLRDVLIREGLLPSRP